MRDDDERGVGLAGDLLEEGHDDAARVRVEGARRLVGEDDARAAHEGARDRDSLLLATTHLARVGVRALTQSHTFQHVDGDRTPAQQLRARGVQEGNLDVFGGRARRKDIELLEHEAEIFSAHARAASLPQARGVHTVQLVRTRSGGIQQADDIEHRGLTRARAAHDGDVLTLRDIQVDAAQNVQILPIRQGHRAGDIPQAHETHCVPAESPEPTPMPESMPP